MSFIAKQYENLEVSAMVAASDSATLVKKMIDLSLGDHDIKTDSRIVKAAAENKIIGHTMYTHPLGDENFREEIIKYIGKNYNHKLNLNNIMVTIGAGNALYVSLKAVLNPGEEVIIIGPYYASYKDQIKGVGGKVVVVNTSEENNFMPTINDIKEKITKKTKAIIVNSPVNPTGSIYTQQLLQQIYDLSVEKKLIIMSDEVYTSFVYDNNKYTSMLEIDKNLTNTVVIKTMSKDYAMTGWRIGYMIASLEIINVARYINDGIAYSAPTIGQSGSIEALRLSDEITTYLRKIYDERIKYGFNRIKDIKNIHTRNPQGGIYLFVNISETGLSGEEFTNRLIKKGVLVLPGNIFGKKYNNYIRITCNKDINILKEAFDKIEELCNF
ncbi:aminotransferase class I/II-fold pyridoxal phosphate-dependent enzyme [Romboutsia maritimum]|uniref:Aminotransferase class I/II-fold pyridoxal phosphate-dependent enzyme n=1 Tax=Romboutsia maritimum TaxID=2020948 RepID=A0A371IVU0_9FIRM|nr:aminotransferase class I/II-fold pyridoxal phosphate-dependent enzyme [Romboutsia maritimum]RDY24586.1 aminotransferase class I/II-fold pyridoxal phosphate-dependent enzyme [Romboutsia maritimum]